MSLLDRLAGMTPRRTTAQQERANAGRAVIAGHMSEIAEAREAGFSWFQIWREAKYAWAEEWPAGYESSPAALSKQYREWRATA